MSSVCVIVLQVGQLLKANNMIVEQEFKLLKTIKVPVRSHGILSEKFERERREAEDLEMQSSSRHGSPKPRIQKISIKSDMKSPTTSTMSFLAKMDEDLQRIKQSNSKYETSSSRRRDWMLNAPLIHPMRSAKPEPTVDDGRVCGISWLGFLLVLLVVCVLLPAAIIARRLLS